MKEDIKILNRTVDSSDEVAKHIQRAVLVHQVALRYFLSLYTYYMATVPNGASHQTK